MKEHDLFVPFKGKHVVAKTADAWIVNLDRKRSEDQGLSSPECWCGATPGTCPDCQDCDAIAVQCALACGSKINIGSGEDGDFFR